MINVTKVWEAEAPFLVWQTKAPNGERYFLQAGIDQNKVSLEALLDKPEPLKPSGVLVTFLRKHARSAVIKEILHDEANGNIWIPLCRTPRADASLYILLCASRPPEIQIIDPEATTHMRRSAKGSYTKKQTTELTLPPQGKDLLPELFAAEVEDDGLGDGLGETGVSTTPEPQGSTAPVLPEYQRLARDRLARRLKTLKKSLGKQSGFIANPEELAALKEQAQLLQSFLYKVQSDTTELFLESAVTGRDSDLTISLDPDLSPGQNLENYYKQIHKAKRSLSTGKKKSDVLQSQINSLTADLQRLRHAPMQQADCDGLLQKYDLAPRSRPTKKPASDTVQASPFRTYNGPSGVDLLVGKSAADNDKMTKAAKANDTWVHVVGIPGSHVIIPARLTKGDPSPQTLQEAAILAIHFSRLRQDQAGEVYITTRGEVRKKKGLPPGLWLVDKAKTSFYRYNREQLEEILGPTRS